MHATTVAVDLARGRILARRRFTRRQFERFLRTHPASHVVMEACGTAHHWGDGWRGHPAIGSRASPRNLWLPTCVDTRPIGPTPKRWLRPVGVGPFPPWRSRPSASKSSSRSIGYANSG